MKKKIAWVLLSCLMVVALVLTSCGPAAEEEEEEVTPVEEEEEEVAEPEEEEVVEEGKEMVVDAFGRSVEAPQYGGTVTFYMPSTTYESIDPVRSSASGWMAALTYECPVIVDWAMGPAGTGENPMTSHHVGDEFLTGCLAESWEIVDLSTMILQIRQGVYWQDKPPTNGREMTVDDIIATFLRYQENPLNTFVRPKDIPYEEWTQMEQTGPWEITFTYYEPSIGMLSALYWLPITPKDALETFEHLRTAESCIGTGAFMLMDTVIGSSCTWKKHPNYWMMDPIHPENRLPYIDIIRGIDIPDYSTMLAALRTHKLDIMGVGWEEAPTMMETNPELLYRLFAPSGSSVIFMRTDIEGSPWADVKVRQALSMAIDQQAIADEFYMGNAYVVTWPIMPYHTSSYTPLEELPTNLRELFEYHPDKAKQLLAEAGYPNGFKCKMNLSGGVDLMSIVMEYFADVGIEMELVVHEGAAFGSVIYASRYEDMIYSWWGNSSPDAALGWAHGGAVNSVFNFSNVVDPLAEEYLDTVELILDPLERAELRKAENLRQMELVWEIPLPGSSGYAFWGPWVKGFHGEAGIGPTAEMGTTGYWRFLWVDQDLKYEITGQRD